MTVKNLSCMLFMCSCVLIHTITMIWILAFDFKSYAEYLDIINFFCQKAYPDYVAHLEKLACAIHPLLDAPPVDIPGVTEGSLRKRISAMRGLKPLVKSGTPFEFLISKTESKFYWAFISNKAISNLMKYLPYAYPHVCVMNLVFNHLNSYWLSWYRLYYVSDI